MNVGAATPIPPSSPVKEAAFGRLFLLVQKRDEDLIDDIYRKIYY